MRQITLTRGEFASVDNRDYGRVSRFKWYCLMAMGKKYAARWDKKSLMLLHRFILGTNTDKEVDHIDGNGLNNRRVNLRECSHQQNMMNRKMQKNNTSGFKGVRKGSKNRWRAEISIDGKTRSIGYFLSMEDAATAYRESALKNYGEFANI